MRSRWLVPELTWLNCWNPAAARATRDLLAVSLKLCALSKREFGQFERWSMCTITLWVRILQAVQFLDGPMRLRNCEFKSLASKALSQNQYCSARRIQRRDNNCHGSLQSADLSSHGISERPKANWSHYWNCFWGSILQQFPDKWFSCDCVFFMQRLCGTVQKI